MTYLELRSLLESKVATIGGLYYSGTLQEFNNISQNIEEDDVVFLNDTRDHNNDIVVQLAGNMRTTFFFRFYIIQKYASDLNEYQLDAYYSTHSVNANKLILSFSDGAGTNYQVLTANAQRAKNITPNLFAGVLLTFSVETRGECS